MPYNVLQVCHGGHSLRVIYVTTPAASELVGAKKCRLAEGRGEEEGGRKQHIRLGALRFCFLTRALKAGLSNLLFCSEGLWGLPDVFTLRRRGEMKYMYLDEDRRKIFFFFIPPTLVL